MHKNLYQEYMERLVVRYIIPLVTVTWISALAKLAHIGILHREWNNLALLETTTTWSQGNSLTFDHSRGRSHSLSSYKPKLLKDQKENTGSLKWEALGWHWIQAWLYLGTHIVKTQHFLALVLLSENWLYSLTIQMLFCHIVAAWYSGITSLTL